MGLSFDLIETKPVSVFCAGTTHNLGGMAQAVHIYKYLWRPEEVGITHANQLINPLREAICLLEQDPEKYEKLDDPNQWGTRRQFVRFLQSCLSACREYPDAAVVIDR